jgi:predicted  nucleic acid-binding Zn-ribbon protein
MHYQNRTQAVTHLQEELSAVKDEIHAKEEEISALKEEIEEAAEERSIINKKLVAAVAEATVYSPTPPDRYNEINFLEGK